MEGGEEEIGILGFVVLLFGLFLVIWLFYNLLKLFYIAVIEPIFIAVFQSSPFFHFKLKKLKLPANHATFLLQQFSYYRALDDNQQKVFQHRVARFLHKKQFHGRQGLEVTDKMRLLIAASAIKLTFGLRKYTLDAFPHIIIYPSVYFSNFTKTHNKGETNARGIIVLSWEDFLEGYRDESDSLNVGLHEFAHALSLQYKMRHSASDSNFNYWYYQWETSTSHPKFYRAIIEKEFFREYASANPMELFAVAVETFFESPHEFKHQLPGLYKLMSKMLNQKQ